MPIAYNSISFHAERNGDKSWTTCTKENKIFFFFGYYRNMFFIFKTERVSYCKVIVII